ncbi:hypothetical protein SAMD00023353_0103380 [Rosellinia necatrix]|uniref:Uncharacterized protein n=1 Tax=Rosellinia necatrix TaxID=77044 RepID=A0A1S7UKB1_ROSNE|nr:hypothetical protein SAMD00023353_0103380 [Rosellinia necatrix]
MSYNSQILMSGAFHFDLPNSGGGGGGRGTPFSGVHPGIFRPPTSPSLSSSMHLGGSTASLQSGAPTPISNAKRKRFGGGDQTLISDWAVTGDSHFSTDHIIDGRSDFDLHTTGYERRYVLAGQMETPNQAIQHDFGHFEDSVYSDIDYRRALGPKRSRDDVDSSTNMHMDVDADSQISSGWSSYAINTIGGVFGKVWEFCRTGAFRGFHAGGGAGYELSEATGQHPARGLSPTFGGYAQPDYPPSYYEPDTPESTPPPPAKRRQISYGTPTDELRKNWVMIDEPANATRQPSLASRASSRRLVQRTAAPSLVRRISKPVSRLNTPGYNRHSLLRPGSASSGPVSSHETASFASFRSPEQSPVMKAQAPSRIPIPSLPQSPNALPASHSVHQPSRIPSPSPYAKRGHRKSQSSVSAALGPSIKITKRDSFYEVHDNTPRLDAKAKNLAAKRLKEEMEADLRINDFNSRLKDMIRQGKEALGTTYEVESFDDGGQIGDPWESE